MEIVELVAEGTMKAAALMLAEPRFAKIRAYPECYEQVAQALKETIKEEWEGLMGEWTDAIEVHMPEGGLQHILNVQCNHMALTALQRVREAA